MRRRGALLITENWKLGTRPRFAEFCKKFSFQRGTGLSQGAVMDMGRIWAGRAGAPSNVPLDGAFEEAFEEPFEEIVRRHGGMVYGLALRFLGDAAQAEDVAQEAFVRLSENLGSPGSAGAHPAAWLRRVTARLCIDEYRRRRKWALPLESIPEPASDADSNAGPADFLALERLRALVAGLPAKTRMVLILRFQEDMQPAEIARALGTPLFTIKSRLKRALAALREKMGAGDKR
jgi:RNA polymerase sigma-70 factor (ECF subfamily)